MNRLEKYDSALVLCDRIEKECGLDIDAELERVPILVNAHRWPATIASARYVHKLYPSRGFALAFAYFEKGDQGEALAYFLHVAIRYPRAALMLIESRSERKAPEDFWEIKDHNSGGDLSRDLEPYLQSRGRIWKKYFKGVLGRPEVVALMNEAKEARAERSANREDRSCFDRIREMESFEFARAQAIQMEAVT